MGCASSADSVEVNLDLVESEPSSWNITTFQVNLQKKHHFSLFFGWKDEVMKQLYTYEFILTVRILAQKTNPEIIRGSFSFPFTSGILDSTQVRHEAARAMPPTRRTHERHLFALESFLARVDRAPHRFAKKVERYRAAMNEDDDEDDDEEVSMYF